MVWVLAVACDHEDMKLQLYSCRDLDQVGRASVAELVSLVTLPGSRPGYA